MAIPTPAAPHKRGPNGPQGAGEEETAGINEINISTSAKSGDPGQPLRSPIMWPGFPAFALGPVDIHLSQITAPDQE